MGWLITIKRVPSRRETLRYCRYQVFEATFDRCEREYYRFGRRYSLCVTKDGRVLDSRRTLVQRFVRWLDQKGRDEISNALAERLARNDEARDSDAIGGKRREVSQYLYRNGKCTFDRPKWLRQYGDS